MSHTERRSEPTCPPTATAAASRVAVALGLCLALALAVGCGAPEEAAPVAGEPAPRVERPELGIALAAVPEGFSVSGEAADELVLVRGDGSPGRLAFIPGSPVTGSVNLVDAVNGHKAETLEQPNGEYKGMIELGSPLGTAFASRGRYDEGGSTVEDFRIFVIHPAGDRVLNLVYRYPAGDDTAERRDQLLSALAEVEASGD